MPRFVGIMNVVTNEKMVAEFGPSVPCGKYAIFQYRELDESGHHLQHVRICIDMNCKTCNGTGGEEISGGHKKGCDKCFGSGVDPALLDKFERASFSSTNWTRDWMPHTTNCPECSKAWWASPKSLR